MKSEVLAVNKVAFRNAYMKKQEIGRYEEADPLALCRVHSNDTGEVLFQVFLKDVLNSQITVDETIVIEYIAG